MKDGFKSIEIEPTEGYLDFIGPAKFEDTNEPARVLKGEVRFTLTKPVKIRNMSVKFKGFSHITLHQPANIEIASPLLPKLKLPLFGRTNLPAGDHVIPWEMDIPNIYPRSLLVKRATINYKVIVSISTGITRTLTAEYPIVLRRHLLPYKELAPIIETKLFQRTVPGKFHYEIDAPQIVCVEQEHIPMAIKYISFANHKPVQSIRTRLVQIELYRRQTLSKSDSDLSCSNRETQIFDLDQKMADANYYKDTHIKYIKRTIPALIHIPDTATSAWKRPSLVRHRLHPYLSYTLDSPLVSIYHLVEVTFQFGMKYEEIKAKIPVIVASIPKRETYSSVSLATDDMMMKYAFEEVARSEFLSYRLESKAATRHIIDDDMTTQNNDNYSIIHDTSIMSETGDDDEGNITGRVTPKMFDGQKKKSAQAPYMVLSNSKSCQYDLETSATRALSPTPPDMNHSYLKQEDRRQLKKFASALDISTVTQESFNKPDEINPEERPRTTTPTMRRQPIHRPVLHPPNHDFKSMSQEEFYKPDEVDREERPRTTTPTMRRQPMQRKVLQPLNIDLANRKDRGPPPPPIDLPLPPPPPNQSKINNDSGSSDVLPAIDRAIMNSRNENSHNNNTSSSSKKKNQRWSVHDDNSDDLRSIYSDSSITSANAPSLSSSATLSTNKSYPTLHSRPPSPVFSPAPGLPATIALRSQEMQASQVEEMFPDSATAMSPAMNTIASSAVLSPRTSYSLQRRIALSTISSLTNDSLQLGPSLISRGRSSSTVDPDIQSLLMMSRYSDNSYDPTPPPPNRYMHARLPPLPTSSTIPPAKRDPNRRLTKIYTDDSDDEIAEEEAFPEHLKDTLAHLQGTSSSRVQQQESNVVNSLIQDDCAPPRLPRLSFGGDFGISLGI